MKNVRSIQVKMDDGEVFYGRGFMTCDANEVYKGVTTKDGHRSYCLSEEEVIQDLERFVKGIKEET